MLWKTSNPDFEDPRKLQTLRLGFVMLLEYLWLNKFSTEMWSMRGCSLWVCFFMNILGFPALRLGFDTYCTLGVHSGSSILIFCPTSVSGAALCMWLAFYVQIVRVKCWNHVHDVWRVILVHCLLISLASNPGLIILGVVGL